MDSQSLRCFLRIVEQGSFGRAAQILNLTQPTLSRRIASLEHELRTQLFVRHQRGVRLTPAGVALGKRAQSLVRQLEELHDEVNLLDREPSGSVAVGLPPSLLKVVNGPLVESYRKKYPRVMLSAHEGISNVLEEKLVNGELDVALMFATRYKLRNASTKILAEEEMVLAKTGNAISQRTWVTIDDIASLPLILYKLPNYIRWRVDVAFQQRGITPNIVVEVNTISMLLEFARRGVGAVIAPQSAVVQDVEEKTLVATPIRSLSVQWMLAISHDREHLPGVKALADHIQSLIRAQIKAGRWAARAVSK
ncbi:LysR family transcriptional regulator [Paraburkholderia sp. CNPSo 3076]|uniref:LysR family transcriptional regulator n=1 Tax=Paraburkholderia sp. CNPSo 3076 TaxID=2940936 RepID=UPI002251D900|nr:LysR family transcriptional regulator [Paraburkholderia sp. CNPSo 3076]MCX5544145.1 LysR family transcriptional regulator [Paraburkholderia sp. CNPSo 3076]